jgi:hypothetical protein
MKSLRVFAAAASLSGSLATLPGCLAQPGQAAEMAMDMGGDSSKTEGAPAVGEAPAPQGAQQAFENLKKLVGGRWEAPMGRNGTLVDTFQPFAFGTAILAEEWVGGQQITSTVFYLVGSELRADHYCDYKNQPRYAAKASADPTTIDFEFRDATNLDTHPLHFHSTTWHLVDATHMTQDWHVEGGPKGKGTVHLEFVRHE